MSKIAMKKADQLKKSTIKKIVAILKRNGVIKAGIFGSYARGDAAKRSDIDLLIKFKNKKSLFDLSGLKIELEGELNKKVDLVTYKYICPKIKHQILKEEIRLL